MRPSKYHKIDTISRSVKRYTRDPCQYCDFHKKKGHCTADCESLKREKEKGKIGRHKEEQAEWKENTVYEVEVLMLRFTEKMMLVKKIKWMNFDFSHNSQVPVRHEGIEPLIIKALVGKNLIHKVYVDNGSSVNIIYKHFLDQLPQDVRGFVKPSISSMVGFAGQVVWPEGQISLPFTLADYENKLTKTILENFNIIMAPSPYYMLLGKTGLWQLQTVPSTVHDLVRFPSDHGVINLRSIPPALITSDLC